MIKTPATATSVNLYFGDDVTFPADATYRFGGRRYATIDQVMNVAMPTLAASLGVRRASTFSD